MALGKKVAIFFIGNGAEIRPLEMGRKGSVGREKEFFRASLHVWNLQY